MPTACIIKKYCEYVFPIFFNCLCNNISGAVLIFNYKYVIFIIYYIIKKIILCDIILKSIKRKSYKCSFYFYLNTRLIIYNITLAVKPEFALEKMSK